jgi:hypothetical protein
MSAVGMGRVEGHDEIRGFTEAWRESYEEFEFTLERLDDLGNDVTVSFAPQRAWLPGSSTPVSLGGGYVGIWRNALLERNTFYLDIDEARVAAERLAQERG